MKKSIRCLYLHPFHHRNLLHPGLTQKIPFDPDEPKAISEKTWVSLFLCELIFSFWMWLTICWMIDTTTYKNLHGLETPELRGDRMAEWLLRIPHGRRLLLAASPCLHSQLDHLHVSFLYSIHTFPVSLYCPSLKKGKMAQKMIYKETTEFDIWYEL